eukprot:404886_1
MKMKRTISRASKHINKNGNGMYQYATEQSRNGRFALKLHNYLTKFEQNSNENNTCTRASQLIHGLLQLDRNNINTMGQVDDTYQIVRDKALHFVFQFCADHIHAKDSILINSLLTLCLEFHHSEQCLLIFNDIQTLHLLRTNVSYSLLLKCLIQCQSNQMDKCIQTLEWMEACHYKLTIHDSFITSLISSCDRSQHLKYIHSLIDKQIITNATKYIKTQLILSYAQLSDIESAVVVFNSIPNDKKDIVSVGAMMTAFIDNQCNDDAIQLYDKIGSFNEKIKVDNICDNLVIKACGNIGDLAKGQSVFQHIVFNESNVQIQNSLIDFFGDCGQIEQAIDVYDRMNDKHRDMVSVGALMKALVNNECDRDALKLYDEVSSSINTTGVVYSLALKACTKLAHFDKGKHIHEDITDRGFRSSYITSALIDFYGNFGYVEQAQAVYSSIEEGEKDIVAVNAMLTVYLNNHLYQDLIELYDEIESMDRIHKNGITHNIALKACGNLCDIEKGKQIHRDLLEMGAADIQIKNTLIGFYGNCWNITKAWNVFDCITDNERDIATINAMMNAYSHNNFHEECVKLYKQQMHMNETDVISHNIAIQSCGYMNNVNDALLIFDAIEDSNKDITTLNMMMQVYIHNEGCQDAVGLYHMIGKDGRYAHLNTNQMSHNLAIKAYTKLGDFEHGQRIIDCMEVDAEDNIAIKNRLIDFYGHCGDIGRARMIFESIDDVQKDMTSINAMLNVYCLNRMNSECLQLFERIKSFHHLQPDIVSYQNVLQACSNDASIGRGKQISDELKQTHSGWLKDVVVQMNLIQLYGKCGYLEKCDELFDEIRTYQPDIYHGETSIWNAMIHSYGRNGNLPKVKELYESMMQETNLCPDRQTYIDMLNTHGHCGESDVKEAKQLWNEIEDVFIKYDCIVITTLVDCLSRKNCLNHAYDIVIDFELKTQQLYHAMWLALLSGCRKFQNGMLAKKIYNEMANRFASKDHCMTHATILLSQLTLIADT